MVTAEPTVIIMQEWRSLCIRIFIVVVYHVCIEINIAWLPWPANSHHLRGACQRCDSVGNTCSYPNHVTSYHSIMMGGIITRYCEVAATLQDNILKIELEPHLLI